MFNFNISDITLSGILQALKLHLDYVAIGVIIIAVIIAIKPKREQKIDTASPFEIWFSSTFNRNNFVTGKRQNGQTHLENMLEVLYGDKLKPNTFFIICGGLFALGALVCYIFKGILASALTGAIIACVPYLVMNFKYNKKQASGSYEGETLINLLLVKYRTANRNIELALEEVIEDAADIPTLRPYLVKMLNRMRMTRDRDEIQAACNDFARSVGTRWAKMLANNIFAASVENVIITGAIEDVLLQLRSAKQLAEERNRANSESTRMFFLIPFLMVSSFLYLTIGLKLSLTEIISRQFGNDIGYILFIVSLLLTIVCFFLLQGTKNKKLDY